jgi:hypothetical protein
MGADTVFSPGQGKQADKGVPCRAAATVGDL